MSWNHRVLAFTQPDKSIYFEVHEVYYDKNNNNEPIGYGSKVSAISGDSKKDLRWQINAIKKALEKPVLWGDESQEMKVYKKLKKKV